VPGRADERGACAVFAVTGLFADEHDRRMSGAGARYALRSVVPERAAPARVERARLLLRVGGGRFAPSG
jgi:hypothetical protein